jgi:squalene cyclase
VARGLKWLAAHQHAEGRWSLDQFSAAGECRGRCGDHGAQSDTAATALGVLPFLGAGHTHRFGEYRDVVKQAIDWLVADQEDDGSFQHDLDGTMYAHGQATIALCEAYALTRDPKLRDPAQRAVNYIVDAQHSEGGWRYHPGQRGDLSVTGWELMALRSAQMAYLDVPEATLKRAWRFLDSVQTSTKVGTFGYMRGSSPDAPMTAEGMLSRQYGGWKADHPPLLAGADYLLKDHLPEPSYLNMYYVYYATQAMHHIGGDRWYLWNKHMRTTLVELQEDDGHEAGSWAPVERHDVVGGRLYMTALAVCTLEVYYRHMPLYRANAAQ